MSESWSRAEHDGPNGPRSLGLADGAQADLIQFEKREATFQRPENGAAVRRARLMSDMATRSTSMQPFP
jgi:hypothetical protein